MPRRIAPPEPVNALDAEHLEHIGSQLDRRLRFCHSKITTDQAGDANEVDRIVTLARRAASKEDDPQARFLVLLEACDELQPLVAPGVRKYTLKSRGYWEARTNQRGI
jgi:hypothetical protein